jgi:hypothetical protein
MPSGGKREGAGRKPGSVMIKTAKIAQDLTDEGTTPLEFLTAVMRDEDQPLDIRLNCAKAAMPYMHPRIGSVYIEEKQDNSQILEMLEDIKVLRDAQFIDQNKEHNQKFN